MEIFCWRRVSRAGISVAWPPLEPGKWGFEKQAPLAFGELRPRLIREVIPSTTYARSEQRQAPSRWGGARTIRATSASAESTASRLQSRSTRPSTLTSARSKATPSRSK